MLYAHFVRGVKPGRVLFRPMTCKGVTCTGLDRTEPRGRKHGKRKSRFFNPMIDCILPVKMFEAYKDIPPCPRKRTQKK